MTLVDYYFFLKLKNERIDSFINNLHITLNESENYDGYYWSYIEVVNNLESGYFDMEVDEEHGELYIFGILIDELSGMELKILCS